ncbi:MAG: PAS domain S-box protein [Thermodesulfovibrio sp.]|nr:PAS domain S-box protein [Thermodesulfovibrio sp.]MDW7997918.1 PAS domain S-box protein [Thermodesulfovibrio sp.]
MIEINSNILETNLNELEKDRLIQELLIHKRELEMQTEELRRLNLEIDTIKNQYIELFNSAPIGYVTININGIIKNCNEAFKNLIGKEADEIVGTPFVNYVDSDDKNKFILNFRDYFNEKIGKKMELKIKGKHKIYNTIILTRPTIDKNSLLLTITDISDIVDRENLIRTYMSIIEAAPVSIVITDRRNRIVYVNENYTKVSGYSKEELMGKDPGVLKSGKTPKETYKELWAMLKEGKAWRGRFINKNKNGEFFIEEAFISPIFDKNGRIINFIAVKRDITEELQRAEREKREEQIRFIYNISGIIAHNLNNINMPILVVAQMLKNEPDLSKYEKELDIIIKSVEKATNLINKILNVSKNIILLKRPITIENLISLTLDRCRDIIPSNIDLVINYENLNAEKIIVDSELISYALYHIIKNSIEAMSEGGKIYIRVYKVLSEQQNSWIIFEIEDQGEGIKEEIFDRVFEPFFTTKLAINALGVGLSEVKGIVEAHEGKVEIESVPNIGTKVKVYLPLNFKDE